MECDIKRFNEAKIKALKDNGYYQSDVYNDKRSIDFSTGFRAGVEWAEDHGDCSIVKFFVDATKEAEDSYNKTGDVLSD